MKMLALIFSTMFASIIWVGSLILAFFGGAIMMYLFNEKEKEAKGSPGYVESE
jgi:hypothetical protein